jgi:hypothetical protein
MRRPLQFAMVAAAALVCAACSKAFLVQEIRSPYQVVAVQDLIVSNSATFDDYRNIFPAHGPGTLRFNYTLMIRNVSKSDIYDLELKQAKLAVGDQSQPILCSQVAPDGVTHNAVASLNVTSLHYQKITCTVQVSGGSFAALKKEDTFAHIEIPFKSGKRSGAISYPYKLKIEDFDDQAL